MRELFNKNKRDIVLGVIVSIITAAIIKAWDWFWVTAPVVGQSFIETIENVTYALAAGQSTTSLVRTLFSMIFGAFVGCSLAVLRESHRIIESASKVERDLKKLDLPESDIAKEAKNMKSKIKSSASERTLNKMIKSKKRTIIIGLLLLVTFYGLLTATVWRPSDLWSRFEKDITMIAPYIENQEILQLHSDWVSMNEKEDYLEIYSYINMVKEKYSLPE